MPKLAQQPLTELAIRKAKPADKRYDLFDASVRGLGLRVATSGTKSWFMMRRFNGRMLRTNFGRYQEVPLALARLKAPDVLADMADGQTAGQRRISPACKQRPKQTWRFGEPLWPMPR